MKDHTGCCHSLITRHTRSLFGHPTMPLKLSHDAPTLLIRKRAFEQHALARADFDVALKLTADEFRVEGDLIAIGPVYDSEGLTQVIADLEARGLVYFEDFFDLSGNWPAWLFVYAMASREGFTPHEPA
jgi:hypothetical protein